MSENGIMQAEQRVREMNMMARQFNEQGNRFMQQRQTAQPVQSAQSARPMQPLRNAQAASRGTSPQRQQTTRFEPVEPNAGRQVGTYNPAGKGGNFSSPRFENTKPVRSPDPPAPPEPRNVPRESPPADLSSLFSGFSMDGEKLMIMLMMYLLIKEKADIKIILALGYLLL